MPNGLHYNPKLFAGDTILFSTVYDITTNTVSLNHDNLSKISEWAVQSKMGINLDPYKEAQELQFIWKVSSKSCESLNFNPLMSGGNKKVTECTTFLLQLGIKGLMTTPFTKFNFKKT